MAIPFVSLLELIFKQALTTGAFPSEWTKGNILTKKGDKKNLENYRSVSLLPICGKFFERLIFNEMFSFFLAKNLLAPNQSDFKLGDSLISFYQLLMRFIHLLMMDLKLEVFSWIYLKPSIKSAIKGLYLNFSKAVCWTVLSYFLRNRKQRVKLNGQSSS